MEVPDGFGAFVAARSPAATARAAGVLELAGGPVTVGGTTRRHPTAGTVTFADTQTGATHSTTATADGTFSLDVPPGTYTVAGTPTGWAAPCTQVDPVTVPAGGISGVDVFCPIP